LPFPLAFGAAVAALPVSIADLSASTFADALPLADLWVDRTDPEECQANRGPAAEGSSAERAEHCGERDNFRQFRRREKKLALLKPCLISGLWIFAGSFAG
jgi:hypothetical protein